MTGVLYETLKIFAAAALLPRRHHGERRAGADDTIPDGAMNGVIKVHGEHRVCAQAVEDGTAITGSASAALP